jgi:putative flavoprotein involved in K+ transport
LTRTAAHEVHLARGERNVSVPQRILGRDIFWWQETLGLLDVPTNSTLGRRMRDHDRTVIGISPRQLTRAGVQLHGRVRDTHANTVIFDDDSALAISSVVWATGFRTDHSWVEVSDAFDDRGTLSTTAV